MSDLWSYLPGGGWPRFCCDVLWQSTLVGLLAWGLLRPAACRPPLRAWLALLALTSALAIPVGSAVLRCGGYGLIARAEPNVIAESSHSPVASIGASASPVLGHQDNAAFAAPDADKLVAGKQPLSCWTLAAMAWAAVSLFFGGRFLLSLVSLRRLQAGAVVCRDQAIVAAAAHAARRVGLHNTPVVEVSSSVCCPTVLALGRPRLYIPPRGVLSGTELDWVAIFCHELAHVRRGDGWGRLWGELAVVLLPWQPAVWLLRRAYHRACDQACDDWAVAAGADPVALAWTLTGWIPQKVAMLAAGAVGSSNVRARVLRLLSLRARPRPRLGLVERLGSMTIVLILAATVAAAQVRQTESNSEQPRPGAPQTDSNEDPDQADQAALRRTGLVPYQIEPPDVLQIEASRLVPLPPYWTEVYDVLQIQVTNPLPDHPIGPVDASGRPTPDGGFYLVEADGTVNFGSPYEGVRVAGMTIPQARKATKRHLQEVLKRPKVSIRLVRASGTQPITGQYLVAADGTVNLRGYGAVHVAGKTIAEAKAALEKHLSQHFDSPEVSVHVAGYNSKVYYVIFELKDGGNQVARIPCTGKERVLDALGRAGLLLWGSSGRKIWISRPNGAGDGKEQILTVDWEAITRRGSSNTNYQILPGDRIFIADPSQPGEKAANGPSDAAPTRSYKECDE